MKVGTEAFRRFASARTFLNISVWRMSCDCVIDLWTDDQLATIIGDMLSPEWFDMDNRGGIQ
jgi:hypothetical protein